MNYVSFLLIAIVTLLTACQTPMQTGSTCTVEPGSLDTESTYAWYTDQTVEVNDTTGFVSPIVVDKLSQAVVSELADKGFRHSEVGANIEVHIALHTRRELVSFVSDPSVCATSDCWERIDMGSATRMDVRTIGFLTADVFYQDKPIWRGWVETTLYPKDRDAAQEVIARSVPKLFETFPP